MTEGLSDAKRNLRALYPETGAGGFTRHDGTVEFYSRISGLIHPDMTVLDYGAGRGQPLSDSSAPFRQQISVLKGRVKHIVGVDIDEAVRENPYMDEVQVIELNGKLPFEDCTFDLIYADWVLEHVATPELFEAEAFRVLKPGGWFCARTPNRWGITGLATNLVPNSLHVRILAKLQPGREARDVFPTTYLLNSRGRLRRHFRPARWDDFSYIYSSEPAYFLRSKIASRLAMLYTALTPEALGMNLHVFLRKKA